VRYMSFGMKYNPFITEETRERGGGVAPIACQMRCDDSMTIGPQ
jgi:hypothetical protein